MVVLVLMLITLPLQLLGSSGTCTQGADDEALAGAVFSAPFLLTALLLMARQRGADGKRRVAHLLAGLAAAGLVAATSPIWLSVLRFGNGCVWKMEEASSADSYDGGWSARNMLMAVVYLILPALVVVLARFDKVFGHLAGRHRQTG